MKRLSDRAVSSKREFPDRPKKTYTTPQVVVYGDASQITQKTRDYQDHNQGTVMGWS